MIVTFLGTGTSQGVPVIGCCCPVCLSDQVEDKRLRTSIMLSQNDRNVVIDTGPDFRYQMLREKVRSLDAIVFTHSHRDHTAGLDDIRAFNYIEQRPMDMFADSQTLRILKKHFDYAFVNTYPGVPQLKVSLIKKDKPFQAGPFTLFPIEVMHHQMPVKGFRIGDFTYITDANLITPTEMEKIKGSRYLVLNALRVQRHISHFSLEEALQIAEQIQPQHTFLTHISHQLGLHKEISRQLPSKVSLAWDGLKIEI